MKIETEYMWAIIDPVENKVRGIFPTKEVAESLIDRVKFVGITVERVKVTITRV